MQPKLILALLASSLSLTTALSPGTTGSIQLAPRQIPAEVPTRSDADGNPVPFVKRQVGKRQIPAEVPTRSDANGNPVPFGSKKMKKREASKPYTFELGKRAPYAQIPAEVPVRSDADGNPVPF